MDRCLLSILPATAYMLSMLISHTFGALEAKEIPRGSLTNHTVWLLTLLEMVMLATLWIIVFRSLRWRWHAKSIWQSVTGDGSEASHLARPTALCISSYDAIYVADECRSRCIAAFDVQGDLLGEVRYDIIFLRNPCAIAAMAVHKNESYMCVINSCFDALYVIHAV